VKAIRGKKTDEKEAKWIADIFKHDLVSGGFIPPADIRQLRDLMGSLLYRQEQELNRQGIGLSRQTMSNWILRASEDRLCISSCTENC